MGYRVLFVCLGNICRSPAAAAIFRDLLARRGLSDEIEVHSAGTANFNSGKPPDAMMIAAAGRRGFHLDGAARQIEPADLKGYDLIVAMDREIYRSIMSMARGVPDHVKLLSDYLGPDSPRDVPDPYRGGAEGFEKVLDLLESALPKVIDSIVCDRSQRDRAGLAGRPGVKESGG
jgi:protein-tyrosine phosphatase